LSPAPNPSPLPPPLSPRRRGSKEDDTLPLWCKSIKKMALWRSSRWHLFSRKNFSLAVPSLLNSTGVQSVEAGRVRLDSKESDSFDVSKYRQLPMSLYTNRNPRSAELLGMAEKPRGFITTKRRVDYYHRYLRVALFSTSRKRK